MAVARLIVVSPDGRRVLARPNGVAGWILPAVPVGDEPWTEADLAAAERIVGAPVAPAREVVDGTWEASVEGRIPAVGVTWIGLDEVARLGADAAAVRRWASEAEG